MFNLVDILKQASILNPSMLSPTNPNSGVIMDDPRAGGISGNMSIPPEIRAMLTPDETRMNQLGGMVDTMPKRADFEPGIMRQILGAIAGLGSGGAQGISGGQPIGYQANVPAGLAAQESVQYGPYHKALSDWSTAIEPVSDLAIIESTRNVNSRQAALGELTRTQTQQKIDQQNDQALRRLEIQDKNAESTRIRSEAYAKARNFAVDHPRMEGKIDSDGMLVYIDPTDPTKIIKTDIDTGKLSDIEKEELRVKGRLTAIAAQGDETRKTEEERQLNRTDLESNKQKNRLELKREPPGTNLSKPQTPAQDRIALQNKANQVILEHPEWSKWIKIDKGIVSVTKPATGGFFSASGPDKSTYDQIVKSLGVKSSDSRTATGVNNSQPEQQNKVLSRGLPADPPIEKINAAKKKLETGNVLITDGTKFGQISASDADKIPDGWKVVN